MSSWMKSIAGQPIAVNVSSMSTTPSEYASDTISPMPTTEIGISGSSTSRRASQSRASTASAGVNAGALTIDSPSGAG
jgi:hypothetical protein